MTIGKKAARTIPPALPEKPSKPLKTKAKSHDKDKSHEKEKGKAKKKKAKKKEAVIIRFEDNQLAGIDAAAQALGLSRAAWVRMTVARALSAG